MKLSTVIITITAAVSALTPGAAARSIVTPLSDINLFPGANYEIDVNAAQANSIDGLGRLYGHLGLTRAYGAASLSRALLGRITEKVGRDNVTAAALDAARRQVQTLRITETSPWHNDVEVGGLQKRKPLKDKPLQVGFIFSNTNEDAYFDTMDGELCIPVKEETFVSFNGRLPHRTVVMSGHADMVGPFSLSSDVLLNVGAVQLFQLNVQGTATYGTRTRRQRQRMIEEGDDTTNTSSADAEINGFVTITGYEDGIDPSSGEKNTTLEVKYNLNGCNGECSVLEVEDDPNFCDEVAVGELDNDNSAGDVDIIEDISTTNEVVEYINVNTSVNTFFGRPIIVKGPKGRVLACAVFKEIMSNYTDVSAEAEGTPMDDSTLSGAISSASVAVWVSLVSSIVVIAALF